MTQTREKTWHHYSYLLLPIGGILMVNVTIYGIHGSYGLWLIIWYHLISLANVRPNYRILYTYNYIITFTHTYICILWTIWISNIGTSVDETSYHHDILPANPLGPQHALLFVALLHFVTLLLINMLENIVHLEIYILYYIIYFVYI